jgi:hypothetical protein
MEPFRANPDSRRQGLASHVSGGLPELDGISDFGSGNARLGRTLRTQSRTGAGLLAPKIVVDFVSLELTRFTFAAITSSSLSRSELMASLVRWPSKAIRSEIEDLANAKCAAGKLEKQGYWDIVVTSRDLNPGTNHRHRRLLRARYERPRRRRAAKQDDEIAPSYT